MRKLAFGGLAGVCATMVMTAVARRLRTHLADHDRYPLPPREIAERMLPDAKSSHITTVAIVSHFAFGAVAGALYACLPRPRPPGPIYGVAVWVLSYMGWIPAFQLLRSAAEHPRQRNAMMVAAHLAWGGALSAGLRELNTVANGALDRQEPARSGIEDAPSCTDARPHVPML